jgi:transcriptional regulator with XRE-family HTH domain
MNKPRISGKALRILLIQKDLTLEQVAKRIGKSKAAVTMTLQGKLQGKETREAIARVIGVSVNDLFAA